MKARQCTGTGEDADPPVILTDEMQGKYRQIQKNWDIGDCFQIGEIDSHNKLVALDKLLLTEGDFVEVGAEIDFVVTRDKTSRPILHAYLTCTHMTRLLTVADASKLTKVSSQWIGM